MENGISPGTGRSDGLSSSSAKVADVGDGISSESRCCDGSLLADDDSGLFQIPVLQGNGPPPLPAAGFQPFFHPCGLGFVVGQLGCCCCWWSVEENGGSEDFRPITGTSFSHDVRRPPALGNVEEDEVVVGACSTSSSEEAKASESGVERRSPG